MDRTRKAFIQIDLGMNSDAIKTAESMSSGQATTVLPLARAAHIFELAGKKGDAEKALKKLRKNSEALDLNSPVFARLAPIAKRLKMPNDWRIQQDSISRWLADLPWILWAHLDGNPYQHQIGNYRHIMGRCIHCRITRDAH